jgi:hypothetical protein
LAADNQFTGQNTFTNSNLFQNDIYLEKSLIVSGMPHEGIYIDGSPYPAMGWADMLGSIEVRNAAGSGSAPSWSAYLGKIYQYSFGTGGGEHEVFVNFHMMHDWAPYSRVYVHAHTSTTATPTGNVQWMFDAIYANGYGQQSFDGTPGTGAVVTVGAVVTPGAARRHQIAETMLAAPGGIDGTAAVVSITSGTPTLTSAAPEWTAADVGKTVWVVGAGAAGADLATSISAFNSTQNVTLANNAGTTVTAQMAFAWRVLDSFSMDIDGLILMRVWRNSARTADTLNVAPFLHFADCHYQTNGILGTKTKNTPFYF